MILVRAPLEHFDSSLPAIEIRADRHRLAKRLWRAEAEDGTVFGFEMGTPLEDGDTVWATDDLRYSIRQTAEPVLAIDLDPKPEAAAILGWLIGNMHFVIEARADHVLAPDDPALRQMFERVGIAYRATTAIFRPHRLARVVGHSHEAAAPESHPYLRPLKHAAIRE